MDGASQGGGMGPGSGGMVWTGEHVARLGRIEDTLTGLDKKLDQVVEQGAVARTEIAWLKWGVRCLFAAVVGVGGVAAHAAL